MHVKSKKAEKENKRVGKKGKSWDWSEEGKKRFKEETKKLKWERKEINKRIEELRKRMRKLRNRIKKQGRGRKRRKIRCKM